MRLSIIRFLFLALCTAALTGCFSGALIDLQRGNAQAEHSFPKNTQRISVPFYWHDGHLMIKLSVNNKSDLLFAFDSGAGATVVFETERTQGLNLDISQTLPLNGNEVNLVADASIQLDTLSINDLVIIHVPIEQSPLFGDVDQAYFDGAIGYDLLRQYTTEIDFDKQLIHFYPQNTELNTTDWQQFGLALNNNVPYVKAAIGNSLETLHQFNWTIDTGAPDYLYMNTNLAKGVAFPANSYTTEIESFEGKQTRYTSRLEHLKLFGRSFTDIASHNLLKFEDDVGVGLIGAGLLRNFNLIFDYQNGTLWTKPNSQFANTTLTDRSGLELEPHKQGAIVKSVSKELTVGIKPNDVIYKINHQFVTQQNFDSLRNLLASNKTELEICWQTLSEKHCQMLALKDRF